MVVEHSRQVFKKCFAEKIRKGRKAMKPLFDFDGNGNTDDLFDRNGNKYPYKRSAAKSSFPENLSPQVLNHVHLELHYTF